MTTARTSPYALSTPSRSPNSSGVTMTTPTTVIPIAMYVPRCSAAARLPDPGFTKNEPMMEAPMPIVAMISG